MRNLRYWENIIKIEKQNKYWANHIDCRLSENFCLQTIAYSVFFFFYKPVSKQNFRQKLQNRLVKTFGQITNTGILVLQTFCLG